MEENSESSAECEKCGREISGPHYEIAEGVWHPDCWPGYQIAVYQAAILDHPAPVEK